MKITGDAGVGARYIKVTDGDSDTETSLETVVVGDLAMKLAVAVKHNSEVPAGKDKTDTESTVTLVYKF